MQATDDMTLRGRRSGEYSQRMERQEFEQLEAAALAPYAMCSRDSRGRVHQEPDHRLRLAFQRDRDRIIHSTAFRRLEYKTQVFVNHEGDYYRTRLTHTMETAQITRTVARALRLNEDLAEAVALSHDLGHTPFGHAGERILNELMADYGGFEHNRQSLRIVDVLEERYPNFAGLNLSWEVREGIVKHSFPYDRALAEQFEPAEAPCLEAQIVDCADEVAYNSHDIDDGLKSGLLTPEQLEDVTLWREIFGRVSAACPGVGFHIWRYQVHRALIDELVTDLISRVSDQLRDAQVDSVEAIRAYGKPIATFSPEMQAKHAELKTFLMENLYRHYRVMRMAVKAQKVMADLFHAYKDEPAQLPPHIVARWEAGESQARVIADYIAGMTDRFALDEHKKLFDPNERV
jgi:dGTPase